MSLLFNMLSRFVIAFLPRSKCLFILWGIIMWWALKIPLILPWMYASHRKSQCLPTCSNSFNPFLSSALIAFLFRPSWPLSIISTSEGTPCAHMPHYKSLTAFRGTKVTQEVKTMRNYQSGYPEQLKSVNLEGLKSQSMVAESVVARPMFSSVQFSSVAQSCPTLTTPWTAARQASLSIANSWSSLKLVSTESVMPSNHLILCRPLLLPSIIPSIRGKAEMQVQ